MTAQNRSKATASAVPVVVDTNLYLAGSVRRGIRIDPVSDIDIVLATPDARALFQVKSADTNGAQREGSTLEDQLSALVRRYAASRVADELAADRLTGQVMKTARRSLQRGAFAHDDLPAMMINIAMRTVNSWEDAARRAHATVPPLRAAKEDQCALSDVGKIRYPNPLASRAVVVGAGRTPTAPYLPEADSSAVAFAERIAGAVARPTVLRGAQATREQTLRAVAHAADEATDLLLVYYAGHGRLEDNDQFAVGTADSMLAFPDLYRQTRHTAAPHMVLIVDACSSGAVSHGVGPLERTSHNRDEYVITSTGPHEAALARDPAGNHRYTAFTGALVDALTRGVPGGGDALDIATLYSAVDQALARETLPRPHLYAAGRAQEQWALAPNPRARAYHKARHRNRHRSEDELLLAASTRGEQRSWEQLVERHGRLVWSTARSFRLDERECGAVYQDTWRLLLRDIDGIDAANLPRYLAETTRRRSLEALRKRVDALDPKSCPICAGKDSARPGKAQAKTKRTQRKPGGSMGAVSKNAKPIPDERQLIELVIAALRHARRQLQDAEDQIERGRWPAALVTAALGLEEIGKAHLCTAALSYSPASRASQTTTFWQTFNSHVAKAALAQTPLMTVMSETPPDAATLYADIVAASERINDAKFKGLYVGVADDGALITPDDVTEADARAVVDQLDRALNDARAAGLSLEDADPDTVVEFLDWWRKTGNPGAFAATPAADTDVAQMLLQMRAMARGEAAAPHWIRAAFPSMSGDEDPPTAK